MCGWSAVSLVPFLKLLFTGLQFNLLLHQVPAYSELFTECVSAVFHSAVVLDIPTVHPKYTQIHTVPLGLTIPIAHPKYSHPLKRVSKASPFTSYLTPLEKSTIHPIDSDSELRAGPFSSQSDIFARRPGY